MRLVALAVAIVAVVVPAAARDWAPRTDLEIVALDVKTGALLWTHAGTPLGNAHFEQYPDLLAVYPHYDNTDKSNPMLLDPKTGAIVADTRDPKRIVKRSSAQWIRGPVTLANGWRLDHFDAGNTKDLVFADRTGKVAWTVTPAQYPEFVLAHGDTLFVAYGYLTDEARLFAYKAGAAKPAWTIDFNTLLGKPAKKKALQRLGRVAPQLVGDTLFVQTGEHVFAIAPETGKIAWRLDAAKALGVKYEPDLYGGALDISVFTRDGDMLVVAFEKRILGVRAATGKLVWSMEPDTFPHSAFPLAHDGRVYLSSGTKRTKAK